MLFLTSETEPSKEYKKLTLVNALDDYATLEGKTIKTIENCFLLSFLSKVGSVTSQVYRGEVRRPYDESGMCSHKLFKAMKNPAEALLHLFEHCEDD